MPLPIESDSFNAQPEAPACPGLATKKAGASGWRLNEQMCHLYRQIYTQLPLRAWIVFRLNPNGICRFKESFQMRIGRCFPCLCCIVGLYVATVDESCFAAPADLSAVPAVVWLEAESFDDVGSWSRDTQHADVMGSTYLLATGLGKPVDDAVTKATIPRGGDYRLWVRCRDWLPGYSPGTFRVVIEGQESSVFGASNDETDAWRWVRGGAFTLNEGEAEIRLKDLTGWYGRVDAVVLATGDFTPSDDLKTLARQRVKHAGVSPEIKELPAFDVVVVGAGPAGMGAAIAAARNGARVALVQDRPVVGGNSSSEILVPPMGHIGSPPDRVNVTGICEELYPKQGWSSFADSELMERIIRGEPNLSLFLNTRAYDVTLKNGETPKPLASGQSGVQSAIDSVLAINAQTGQRLRFRAPIFIDCTGHGWIGYYAGAEYHHGQEARSQYGEALAPVEAGDRTQGNTLYNSVIVLRDEPTAFACPEWAYPWAQSGDFQPLDDHRRITDPMKRPENYDRPAHGKGRNPGDSIDGDVVKRWYIELGGMCHTVWDAEEIRDDLFRINLGLWDYAKNHNPVTSPKNRNRELVWMNYVPGVRESRRLMGPYVMTQADFDLRTIHPDTVAFTDWGIDVHHPEGFWVDGNDCIHVYGGRRVSIPYRSLYSRNITNLMMAGRCHSASHIAMGGTRVMRPCLGMGQAAGTAAAIAVDHDTSPHRVCGSHLGLLQQTLLKDGCYLIGFAGKDPRDLAREATVTASSSAADMPPEKTTNGWNRIIDGDRNAWRAKHVALREKPWIEFAWDEPRSVNVAHVTFESEENGTGVEFLADIDGQWQKVGVIDRFGIRRYVVALDGVKTCRVRLAFERPVAVCEVRLYDEPAHRHEAIRARNEKLLPLRTKKGPAVGDGMPAPDLAGLFLDDREGKVVRGQWRESVAVRPYFGTGYLHNADDSLHRGRPDCVFRFSPEVQGRFEILLAYAPSPGNRASNGPVVVRHADGETSIPIDQRKRATLHGRFVSLGTFTLDKNSSIELHSNGADGIISVDGLHLLPSTE